MHLSYCSIRVLPLRDARWSCVLASHIGQYRFVISSQEVLLLVHSGAEHRVSHLWCPLSGIRGKITTSLWLLTAALFLKEKTNVLRRNGVLLAGPGSDGIMVTWKDNFDSFYNEVAELGRYDMKPAGFSPS